MSEQNGNGNSPVDSPAMMPGLNGGMLRRGGTPGGRRANAGRPLSLIREKLRGSFEKRIKILQEIADGDAVEIVRDPFGKETAFRKSASVSDRLKAVDLLAKYGLGTTVTETDTEGNDVRGRYTPEERRAALLRELAEP